MPGLANLITTFGITPWPHTLGLARVHVAPNQKLCSVLHAVESAKEHFKLDGNMESPYYYLTPVSTEAPYILSDVGLQSKDDVTRVIGVAAMCIDPADNTVDLAASEGPYLHFDGTSPAPPQGLLCPRTSTTLLSCVDQDEEGHHPVRIIYLFYHSICSSGQIGGRHYYASIGVHTEPCRTGTSSAGYLLPTS